MSDRRRLQSFLESPESNQGKHYVSQLDRGRIDRAPRSNSSRARSLSPSARLITCQVVQRPGVIRVEIEHSFVCTRGARFVELDVR